MDATNNAVPDDDQALKLLNEIALMWHDDRIAAGWEPDLSDQFEALMVRVEAFLWSAARAAAPVNTQPQAAMPVTRLDVMSLIRSQMHRSYTAGYEGNDIDPKYIAEIEDAIAAIYYGRYIAGYDLRKSEEAPPSPQPAADSTPTIKTWQERSDISRKPEGQVERAMAAEIFDLRAALQPVAGLTDAEIDEIAYSIGGAPEKHHRRFARAIEAHITGNAGDQKGGV